MHKDWTGNGNSVWKTLGASNHTDKDRHDEDWYSTEPKAGKLLLEVEEFTDEIFECAVGDGSLAQAFTDAGHTIKAMDIVDRGYPNTIVQDFLTYDEPCGISIITNPPYKFAVEFVRHALDISVPGNKVAMFLKVQFLEGKSRKELFRKYPPKTVYVSSSRLVCAKNSDFEGTKGSAVAYAWYVWEKGYAGDSVVKWIN